ncbi:flagellar basal body-associated FliL family protein [Marinobacter sp. X15-166B]|uniref:flagellar basal body-associated FliL family protein n=1 Tax=Marinobacter sp. X15-166B TaxID=1897620 RepID=UPI00085CCE87|nr:flagellar basal body-associated FliL family protein [Marinobacter sp. X15-166B]OEY67073.1 flagellar basal body protein FliL [Marinobacter sp. X15-166B]
MAAEPEADVTPRSGTLKTTVLLATLAVLAIGLSIAGTLWFLADRSEAGGGTDDPAELAAAQEPAFTPSQYQVLDKALVTTVQAEGRQRYVQVHLAFEADNGEALAAARLHLPLLRSQMIGVLSGSDFMALQAPNGRAALTSELLAAVNRVLEQEGAPGLRAVLLRNFVLQ